MSESVYLSETEERLVKEQADAAVASVNRVEGETEIAYRQRVDRLFAIGYADAKEKVLSARRKNVDEGEND